jgi:hypothetical protein
MGASTFASADDFGAEVDEWHSQLVQVPYNPCCGRSAVDALSLFLPIQSQLLIRPRRIEKRRRRIRCSSSNSDGAIAAASRGVDKKSNGGAVFGIATAFRGRGTVGQSLWFAHRLLEFFFVSRLLV